MSDKQQTKSVRITKEAHMAAGLTAALLGRTKQEVVSEAMMIYWKQQSKLYDGVNKRPSQEPL